eukprot:7566272-Lingulodinium_polyedra.AAC.1
MPKSSSTQQASSRYSCRATARQSSSETLASAIRARGKGQDWKRIRKRQDIWAAMLRIIVLRSCTYCCCSFSEAEKARCFIKGARIVSESGRKSMSQVLRWVSNVVLKRSSV